MPFNSLNVSDFSLCHQLLSTCVQASVGQKAAGEKKADSACTTVATQCRSVRVLLPTDQIIAWVWISKSLQL